MGAHGRDGGSPMGRERRTSNSSGFGPEGRRGSQLQGSREARARLSSISKSTMRGSFDVSTFLAEKNLDIETKTFKDIFPVASGPDSEETTSKFLYAIVEILLDFINQTNDRDGQVLDFHHPSQITKAMDFTLPEQGLDLEQLVVDCRTALR